MDMFRDLRRKKQQISSADTIEILNRGTSGVLAVSGDDGYPYAVPLSYAYHDSKIVFHCAKTGHKLDAIKHNSKVSFCVIDKDQPVAEEYTTYYRSVIAFGHARVLEDDQEKRDAIQLIAAKYTPDDEEGRNHEIDRQYDAFCIVEITIDHLAGKEARELARAKQNSAD